ncbi:DEAD/DEAH box helicase [Alteribacter natronophilus]|uniref:DEAD/DEAH box helicase n=1 Tax=Alteribacter natronophilus TaxID=2583810 RepID=UPI00110F57D7|nr:DEAD/DEAH box helicase [Alteribacter natronophilus]TMW73835.1 DEAD/DEAH box helicase [Alteribacter natronophilus]
MKHNFERFNLQPFLIEALKQQQIELPMEIQERLIPAIRNGSDVIGQSQTGTGKTLAFLLPLADRIDPEKNHVQAVITAPTRELAGQLFEELGKLLHHTDGEITAKLVTGGTDRSRMVDKLKNPPHIAVGTPGRIHDMVKEQALDVHQASMYVVDEADQMLDMGFLEDVDQVGARMTEDLQMMVFSATIPEKLQPFLRKYMKHPKHVKVEPKQASPRKIEHWLIPDRDRDVNQLALEVATAFNPFLAVIFANSKEEADELFAVFAAEGLNAEKLHGGISPRERKKVMKKLRDAEVQYLIASDLVARGIDVKGISHIINVGLPRELEYYVHRVGRTARAGWDGIAATIAGRHDQAAVEKLESQGIKFLHKDLKKGEWVELEQKMRRRKKQGKAESTEVTLKTGKPKKVKPGYKKKFQQQKEQEQKRQRRLEQKRNNRAKRK